MDESAEVKWETWNKGLKVVEPIAHSLLNIEADFSLILAIQIHLQGQGNVISKIDERRGKSIAKTYLSSKSNTFERIADGAGLISSFENTY